MQTNISTKKKIRGKPLQPGHSGLRKKGTKNKATLIKESIGLDGWQKLCEFVSNEGAVKYVQEVSKLQDESYIRGFSALLEYVKPKLVRSEALNIDLKIDNITFE
mgnify:CR=1 FL=1